MAENRRTILVTGATGQQGGAVARHLLKADTWTVRALTRDAEKPDSLRLSQMGAEVVQGDMKDPSSLAKAVDGVYGIFSVQNSWTAGIEGEIEEGKKLADAAKAAGIQHFVYTSVGGAERNTNIPHFDSKWEIEEYVRSLDLPWTIFRPVWFMENFGMPDFRTSILNGTLSLALPPDRSLQMIAVDDIGAFVALAFSDPEHWKGQALELAGDELTIPQAAGAFSQELGRPVEFVEMTIEQVYSISKEWAVMLQWFNDEGYKADIGALRQLHPELMRFTDWLHTQTWVREGHLIEQATGQPGQANQKAA